MRSPSRASSIVLSFWSGSRARLGACLPPLQNSNYNSGVAARCGQACLTHAVQLPPSCHQGYCRERLPRVSWLRWFLTAVTWYHDPCACAPRLSPRRCSRFQDGSNPHPRRYPLASIKRKQWLIKWTKICLNLRWGCGELPLFRPEGSAHLCRCFPQGCRQCPYCHSFIYFLFRKFFALCKLAQLIKNRI